MQSILTLFPEISLGQKFLIVFNSFPTITQTIWSFFGRLQQIGFFVSCLIVQRLIWISHVSYKWVVSGTNELRLIWIIQTGHKLYLIRMSHVSYQWVMSHMNESCLIWMSHVSYEWVMSHMNESCLVRMSHVSYESHEWGMSRVSYQWDHDLSSLVGVEMCHAISVEAPPVFFRNGDRQATEPRLGGLWVKLQALQQTATDCNRLQHTATDCYRLPNTRLGGLYLLEGTVKILIFMRVHIYTYVCMYLCAFLVRCPLVWLRNWVREWLAEM